MDGVLEIFASNDRNYRPEDLFLSDAHLGIDINEYRWLHEPAILIVATFEAVAAALQFCAFRFADFDLTEIGLELGLVDGRTHVGCLVQAVTHAQGLGAFDIPFYELAIDSLLHNDAAGGGAALAGGSEASPQSAFDGQVEVGVVEHDHGILAAKFERAMFETLGCGSAYDASDGGGAGQRNG